MLVYTNSYGIEKQHAQLLFKFFHFTLLLQQLSWFLHDAHNLV